MPSIAMANSYLTQQNDFGEGRKELEESWQEWLHHYPFDLPVLQKLSGLLTQRLQELDKKKEAAKRQKIENQLSILQSRIDRYAHF